MELKDVITVGIAAAAFVLSFLSFAANWKHAGTLFKTKEYPELEFDWETDDNGEIVIGKTYRAPMSWVEIELRNRTQAIAIDVSAVITLASGLCRLAWEDTDSNWSEIGALEDSEGGIGKDINRAMANLRPESLCLCEGTNANGYRHDWLQVKDGKRAPKIALVIHFRWRPALWKTRQAKKRIGIRLEPQMGEHNVIDYWSGKPLPRSLPLRLACWRPRSVSFKRRAGEKNVPIKVI